MPSKTSTKLATPTGERLVLIPRNLIEPNPRNPRSYFNPKALAELARCIEEEGQQTPVDVMVLDRPSKTGALYQLIEGERRWRATAMISRDFQLRAIVKEIKDENDQYIRSGIANLGREGYTYMDAARLLENIRNIRQCTQAKLAVICGKDEFWVSRHLSLLKLHPKLQQALEPSTPKKDKVPFTLAVELSKFPLDKQIETWKDVKGKKLNIARSKDVVLTRLRSLGPGVVDGRSMGGDRPLRRLKMACDRLYQDSAMIESMSVNQYVDLLKNRHVVEVQIILDQLQKTTRLIAKAYEKITKAKGQVAS
jgi:ParB/RepB/Spo0J family partition protein